MDFPLLIRGSYSVIRFTRDIARNESRNIGVLLVAPDAGFAAMRCLPPASVSKTLAEQGLLTGVLDQLREHLVASPTQPVLEAIGSRLNLSLSVTDPLPTATADHPRLLLDSLYANLVAPKSHVAAGYTKGHMIDRLARWTRQQGQEIELAAQVDDYTFDAVLRLPSAPVAFGVTSLAARHLDQHRIEQEATHFLFGTQRVHAAQFVGLLQPPPAGAEPSTRRLYARLVSWHDEAGVPVITPRELPRLIPIQGGANSAVEQLALA